MSAWGHLPAPRQAGAQAQASLLFLVAARGSRTRAGIASPGAILSSKPPSWFSYFGPAALPQPIVARLNAEIGKAVNSPDVRAKFKRVGMVLIAGMPD